MSVIVTTLRCNPARYEPVFSFIAYHLAVGFSHVYLFIDHESNKDLQDLLTAKFSSKLVTVFINSSDLQAAQRLKCSIFNDLESYLNEVPVRQTINAEYVYHLASEQGYRWLLHIDIDELFYISGNDGQCQYKNVDDHFNYLDSINVQSMTYVNHEGVPEVFDCADYFQSVTLFRRHHFSLPFNNNSTLAINFWKQRTTHEQYFLVYDCGKSAVRLGIPGTVPRDVHRWKLHKEDDSLYRTNLMDPRHLNVKQYLKSDEPCILHYVTCGMRWLLDKYNILGRFPNFWFGDRLPIAPSFHLTARDVVLGENSASDEEPSICESVAVRNKLNTVKFYLSQIMLNCAEPDVTVEEVRKFFLENESGDDCVTDRAASVVRELLVSVGGDNSAVRDQQLQCGVLLKLNRVQSVLEATKELVHDSAPVDVESLRTRASGIVARSFGISQDAVTSHLSSAVGAVTISKNGEISEMDRLRIISQVAFNFL